MHNIDLTTNEFEFENEFELEGEGEFEFEFEGEGEFEFEGEMEGEALEMELTTELLEVNNERELEQFYRMDQICRQLLPQIVSIPDSLRSFFSSLHPDSSIDR